MNQTKNELPRRCCLLHLNSTYHPSSTVQYMMSATTPSVREEVIDIAGWPTDTVAVEYIHLDTTTTTTTTSPQKPPHTILIFVPGNPGCIGWYTPNLIELVTRLGHGFAARGASYASHSPNNESLSNVKELLTSDPSSRAADVSIPWTVDGQIRHKSAFLDHILSEYPQQPQPQCDGPIDISLPRFIFLSHSIGAHMVERLLCWRPHILSRTLGVVHITPFTRMQSYPSKQPPLDWAASTPDTLINVAQGLMQVLRVLPPHWVDYLLDKLSSFDDREGRTLAVRLLRQPWYAKNFFELGTEEIRDVPETVDTCALRFIGQQCPIAMLYAGKDQWGPDFHARDLKELQAKGIIPANNNITIAYMPELRHDYVSRDWMVPKVVDWCYESIIAALQHPTNTMMVPPRSRL